MKTFKIPAISFINKILKIYWTIKLNWKQLNNFYSIIRTYYSIELRKKKVGKKSTEPSSDNVNILYSNSLIKSLFSLWNVENVVQTQFSILSYINIGLPPYLHAEIMIQQHIRWKIYRNWIKQTLKGKLVFTV